MDDKSKYKEASILRLKSELIQNRKFFEDHTLKKKTYYCYAKN